MKHQRLFLVTLGKITTLLEQHILEARNTPFPRCDPGTKAAYNVSGRVGPPLCQGREERPLSEVWDGRDGRDLRSRTDCTNRAPPTHLLATPHQRLPQPHPCLVTASQMHYWSKRHEDSYSAHLLGLHYLWRPLSTR